MEWFTDGGHNTCCDSDSELDTNDCVYNPELILNLENIKSICFPHLCTYFLSKNGSVYFYGQYLNQNGDKCYQKTPSLKKELSNINSLLSINCYQTRHPIACALSDECVYSLKDDKIIETGYKKC